MKKASIKMAILIPVLAVLIVGVMIMVIIVSTTSSTSATNLTDELIEARVNEYVNKFEAITAQSYTMVQTLVPTINDIRQNSDDPRSDVVSVLEETLAINQSVVALWTYWKPNAFDGNDSAHSNANAYHDATGLFVPFVFRDGNAIRSEPLVGHEDPDAPHQVALTTGKPYITDPYAYDVGSETLQMYSAVIPIVDNGQTIGVIGIDIDLEEVITTMNAASILSDGYLFVLSPGGMMASHSNRDMILTDYRQYWMGDYASQFDSLFTNGGHFSITAHSDVTNTDMRFLGTGVKIGDTPGYWVVCGVVPDATANASANQLTVIVIVSGLMLIVLAGLTMLLLINSRLRRLPLLTAMAKSIAAGDLRINIVSDTSTTKNEITLLERSFSDVVSVVNGLINDLNHTSDAIQTDGDIDARVDISLYTGAYKELADSVNHLVNNLVQDNLTLIHALTMFGNGDFNFNMPLLPGKKVIINNTFDNFKSILQSINDTINTLVKNVLDGQLTGRADVSAYQGDWNKLVGAMNSLMQAVSAPTIEISAVMDYVAQGNFDHKMTGEYKGDFLTLQNAINTTVTNVSSYIDEIARVLTNLSQNDLDQQITREYVGSFATIKNAMNHIVNTFNTVIGDITSAAEQVASGARSISESSMSLATGATEQASSVEELTATVLVINESTQHNAENAKSAEDLSNSSKENASKGDKDMKDMLTSMDGIKESSNKISRIIKVIEDIAFQTNLLALNAAVEAARAGEHGKGFAVVAEEVRTLASRSKTAANETADLIEESISRVEEGTLIANKTAEALKTIVEDIDKVAEIIFGITKASHEQSEAVTQVVQGLNQITTVVQNNSATSEESASASQELSSQSEIMRNLVSVFNLKRNGRN